MIWDEMSHIGFPKHFSTPGEWREWRRLNTVFTDIAATEPGQATLSGDGDPEQVPGRRVTSNVRGIPGVVSAGAISRIPLTANDQTTGYLFAGQPANDARAQDALSRVVSRDTSPPSVRACAKAGSSTSPTGGRNRRRRS